MAEGAVILTGGSSPSSGGWSHALQAPPQMPECRASQRRSCAQLLPLPLGRAKGEKRTRTMKVGKYPDVQKKFKIRTHSLLFYFQFFPRMHAGSLSIPLYKWHTDHIRGTEMGPRFRLGSGAGVEVAWRDSTASPCGKGPSPQTWLQYHLLPS